MRRLRLNCVGVFLVGSVLTCFAHAEVAGVPIKSISIELPDFFLERLTPNTADLREQMGVGKSATAATFSTTYCSSVKEQLYTSTQILKGVLALESSGEYRGEFEIEIPYYYDGIRTKLNLKIDVSMEDDKLRLAMNGYDQAGNQSGTGVVTYYLNDEKQTHLDLIIPPNSFSSGVVSVIGGGFCSGAMINNAKGYFPTN